MLRGKNTGQAAATVNRALPTYDKRRWRYSFRAEVRFSDPAVRRACASAGPAHHHARLDGSHGGDGGAQGRPLHRAPAAGDARACRLRPAGPARRPVSGGPGDPRTDAGRHGRSEPAGRGEPVLHELCTEVGETVSVIILEGTKVRFADSLEGQRHSVRVTTRAGKTMPAHCTSGGKVMLACLPEDELERRYPGRVLDRPSERCIPEWAELVKELNGIRRRRWATNVGEGDPGDGGVGVAIRSGSGGPRAAIAVGAPLSRMGAGTRRRVDRACRYRGRHPHPAAPPRHPMTRRRDNLTARPSVHSGSHSAGRGGRSSPRRPPARAIPGEPEDRSR
jgi:hypothetical protein